MNRKWVSRLVVLSFLSGMLCEPVIGVTTALETETSETQTESTVDGTTALSDDVLETVNEPNVSEEEAVEEAQEPVAEEHDQEEYAEATYEERDLSKKDKENGAQPVVQAKRDSESLQGEITLSSDTTGKSKTILKTVALQTKTGETDWQEVKVFDDSKEHILNDSSFDFEYQGIIEDQDYRIVVDYVIEEPNGEYSVLRTFHKGQILFESRFENSESVTGTQESEAVEANNEELLIGPVISQSETTIEDSIGITPRAVSDVEYIGSAGTGGKVSTYVKIQNIKSREATIEYKYQLYSNSNAANTRYVVWSKDKDRMTKLFANVNSASQMQKAQWNELQAEGNLAVISGVKTWDDGSATFGPGKMTNLEPNTTYYVWLISVPTSEINIGWQHPTGTYTPGGVANKYIPGSYVFKTDVATALTITAPTFTQASATTTTIPMVGKAYTGDIFQTSGQGKVQVTSNDGTTVQDKVTNLSHTTTEGGTYGSATVSGLTAGTRYKGRTALKDYSGTWKYSAWSSYFYTPNTVNQPSSPTLNTPTAANNATAAVSATYNAGDVAAHATSVEVQTSTNNSTWTTLSTTSTPATTTATIATGSKSVSFTLSKLNAKTKYYVRYRVKNASNVWSAYSASREFTTGAMALSIATPTFSSATHNAIYMTGSTYTGDIFQTSGQAKVQVTPDDGTTVQDKVTNLTHTVSQGGTYHNITVPNLAAGTRYKGRVAIKDYSGTWRYSGWSSYFYTVNTVNPPTISTLNTPTTSSNATAAVTAVYNVGDVAAHPTSVEVQTSTDNSTWTTLSTTSTPATTTPTIATGSKSISFTLSKLNSRTKYYVRYRVKNASDVWSGYPASSEFTTKAVPLTLNTPTFIQSNATATTIPMIGNDYTGDIFQTSGQGKVQVTSNNENIEFTTLRHTVTTGGTYDDATVTGLAAGTRYKGRVAIKDYDGTWQYSAWTDFFYTPNTVNQLGNPTLNIPTTDSNATAGLVATYNVGDTEAHPTSVEIQTSTNNSTWTTLSTASTPATNEPTIISGSKTVNFILSKLNANTTYYVRYRVKNESNIWSDYSASREFTTNQRQAGLYVSDVPTFNFGVQSVSSSESSTKLANSSVTDDFGIKLENVGISESWSFSARLSSLRTQDGSNQELTGANILFNKELQKTTDGVNWATVTQDFEGLVDNMVILPSDSSTIQLWRATNELAGQGKFKAKIDFDSVRLIIPGNIAQKGTYYEGKIEWILSIDP